MKSISPDVNQYKETTHSGEKSENGASNIPQLADVAGLKELLNPILNGVRSLKGMMEENYTRLDKKYNKLEEAISSQREIITQQKEIITNKNLTYPKKSMSK